MKKQKLRFRLSYFLLLIFFLMIWPSENMFGISQEKLPVILKNCAQYCDKLIHSVLFFVCKENMMEETYALSPRRTILMHDEYLYDYQLIRKNNVINEQRILLKQNGMELHKKNAKLQTKFQPENIIGGPIRLLCEYWQSFHDYKIVQEKKFKGDEVFIVEAVPKSGIYTEHLYGKVWVKKADYSVVKIEWTQESIKSFQAIKASAERLKLEPSILLSAEYAYIKNGIRFPNRLQIDENYISSRGQKLYSSKTIVEYKDYRFFTVETIVNQ